MNATLLLRRVIPLLLGCATVSGLFSLSNKPETTLTAPAKTGAYRLFGYVFDGKGGAALVNIPFHVESPSLVVAQDKGY